MAARRLAIGILILAGVRPAPAQLTQIYVRRPQLLPQADTSDAAEYLQLARSRLLNADLQSHAEAEAALIWAARLDPGSADPPYLLAIAVLRPIIVQATPSGHISRKLLRRELTSERVRYLDSLTRAAWLREPLLDFDLEPLLSTGRFPRADEIQDPVERGYVAYRALDPRLALDSWALALVSAPTRVDLRFHRAHTFYYLRMYDSAAAELRAVLATNKGASDTGGALAVPSEDVLEYSLAVAYERAGRMDSAKEAYHRAIAANLGLYMARVRLSGVLLGLGDTSAAMHELSQAVDIAPREPWLLSYYGYMLLLTGRPREAIVQLNAAIALDSSYSTPYFLFGAAATQVGQDSAGLASFESFLQRSARKDERRAWTRQRIGTIRATMLKRSAPDD